MRHTCPSFRSLSGAATALSTFHVAFCTLALAFAIAANAGDLVLVKDGVPQATIVADTNATPSYALAATELRDFVRRMSGAELPIAAPGDAVKGPRILIGMNPVTEAMNSSFRATAPSRSGRMASVSSWQTARSSSPSSASTTQAN